ncbi:Methionine aminopeptidase 1 [Posidoniimonas polymericola]|uniref:Methionine aminopeptidase n=1 Tax=Posidoniimonas polymericola TaxID=2528002 RepID=A0A5C5YD92_9BACT|nr:type I methionyl aminopeptidase [Posidoniimonas polymericola]TWT73676.1 Methionine aminopeptidase 1 [Posidoniimonas polymericola]
MIQLKSDREIAKMRLAGLAVWRAHQIAAEMMQPGATTREIDAALDDYFAKIGATPLFKNYPHHEKGKPAFPAVTCMSRNEVVVHGIPDDVPLAEGDILSIDTGVRLGGWCGDAAVTHAIGEIDPVTQRLLDVTQGALQLAFDLLHTKDRWSQIADEMARYVKDHGFATVEDFVGHGIGRKMHEDPQVPNFVSRSLRGRADFFIEPGLVLAIEPMVNVGTAKVRLLRDAWTQVTKDGKPSAHFEHTIAITKDGPVRLTVAPSADEEALMEDLMAVSSPGLERLIEW